MSIVATTASAAITAVQTSFAVASTTNITNPNFQTGGGITLLYIDQEYMLVTNVNTTTLVVNVVRGVNGTAAQAHVSGSLVQSGLPTDFGAAPTEILLNLLANLETIGARKTNAVFLSGSADAISNSTPGIYVIKTAGVDAMTLTAPPASAEGIEIQIWSDTTNAHTLTATSLLAVGTALKTTATWPAFRGAGLTLRAVNGVWHVIAFTGTATGAGPIAFT